MSNNFNGWGYIIPKNELKDVTNTLNKLYQNTSIIPSKSLVFQAFKKCNYIDLDIIILIEDLNFQFNDSIINYSKQGILILNTVLTSEKNKPGSHTLLWRPFIKQFLLNLQEYNPGLIYVLLGDIPQSFERVINPKMNHIIKEKHSNCYLKNKIVIPNYILDNINQILYNNNGYKINW